MQHLIYIEFFRYHKIHIRKNHSTEMPVISEDDPQYLRPPPVPACGNKVNPYHHDTPGTPSPFLYHPKISNFQIRQQTTFNIK